MTLCTHTNRVYAKFVEILICMALIAFGPTTFYISFAYVCNDWSIAFSAFVFHK